MKNKYAIRSKISEAKIRQIVRLFAVDLDALQIAQIAGVNRNTVNRYLAAFRERIAHFCEAESPVKGEVEVDESYFGARRVRGLRGRGRVELESIIHSDGWRGYDGLVDLGYQKHFRVQHGNNEFANKHSHINGIESFWAFSKTRLVRFRGLAKHTFYFHLKECEFRFNHRNEDLYKLVLKMLREEPLC